MLDALAPFRSDLHERNPMFRRRPRAKPPVAASTPATAVGTQRRRHRRRRRRRRRRWPRRRRRRKVADAEAASCDVSCTSSREPPPAAVATRRARHGTSGGARVAGWRAGRALPASDWAERRVVRGLAPVRRVRGVLPHARRALRVGGAEPEGSTRSRATTALTRPRTPPAGGGTRGPTQARTRTCTSGSRRSDGGGDALPRCSAARHECGPPPRAPAHVSPS